MNNILQGMANALAYVYDIIVFSANEHIEQIYFNVKANKGWFINPTKSEF